METFHWRAVDKSNLDPCTWASFSPWLVPVLFCLLLPTFLRFICDICFAHKVSDDFAETQLRGGDGEGDLGLPCPRQSLPPRPDYLRRLWVRRQLQAPQLSHEVSTSKQPSDRGDETFLFWNDQINFVIKDIIKWNSNFIEKSSPYAWLVMSNVLLISVEDQPNLMRSSRSQKNIPQDRFCCDLRGFGETTCLLFPSAQIMHYALQVCLDSWKLGTKVKQIINILTILSSSSPLSRIIAGLWRRIIHAAMSFQHGRFIEMMRNVTMMLMIVSWWSSSRWE